MGETGTRLLYQDDSYLRSFEATVLEQKGDAVILDQTAFHPRPSGGLSNDTGILEGENCTARVVDVTIENGVVYHWVEADCRFTPGERVVGRIDWARRYRMMRLHTASHIIAALLYDRYGARVTGGMIEPDKAKDDFDLSMVDDWKGALRWAVEEANRIAKKCLEVKVYWAPRSLLKERPELVKLAARLPPSTDKIRIVEIPGVDVQADGGPHVRNTCEIGEIVLLKLESKGRKRRRLYYTVEP